MEKRVEGKPVGFDIIRIGKTLIKLKDGNYIQVDPEGNPVYIVNTSNVLSVWRPEQIKEMEE